MPLDIFNLWLLTFAGWRLTSIINRERIGRPIRRVFGESIDAAGLESYPATFFGYLISCFKCLSVWTSVLCLVAWLIWPWILMPFALSASILLLEKYL